MAPARTMTGDTVVGELEKRTQSPASPTHTDDTLRGDAIIEIREENGASTTRPSLDSRSSVNEATAQPHTNTGTKSLVLPKALRSGRLWKTRTPCRVGAAILRHPDHEKKRPTFLRRVTGFFNTEDPVSITETSTRTLENTPNGFPRLAAFQSSEANFSLYRSFSYLHSRILLDLQDEITALEKELDEIDWDDFEDDPHRLRSREVDVAAAAREGGDVRNRRMILRDIKAKLMEYDEVLIKARTLESFQKPSDRNYRSLRRYHHNTKPLMDAEMDSVRSKEDTVSLRSGREWATFDGGVETVIGQVDHLLKVIFRCKESPLQKYFRTPELRAKTKNSYIAFYSSARIDKLINILITFVIFILLVVPVVTMYQLTSTTSHTSVDSTVSTSSATDTNTRNTINAVGVLIVFTLLFSATMALLTKAARHELFAASAAYCAILVVFIGNFTGPGN